MVLKEKPEFAAKVNDNVPPASTVRAPAGEIDPPEPADAVTVKVLLFVVIGHPVASTG